MKCRSPFPSFMDAVASAQTLTVNSFAQTFGDGSVISTKIFRQILFHGMHKMYQKGYDLNWKKISDAIESFNNTSQHHQSPDTQPTNFAREVFSVKPLMYLMNTFLDFRSLTKASFVCRSWMHDCFHPSSIESFNSKSFMSIRGSNYDDECPPNMDRFSHVKSIHLHHWNSKYDAIYEIFGCTTFKNLEHVVFERCRETPNYNYKTVTCNILKNNPDKLKTLITHSDAGFDESQFFVRRQPKELPNLTKLGLHGNVTNLSITGNELSTLILTYPGDPLELAPSLINNFDLSKITHFECEQYRSFNWGALASAIVSKLTNLESLYLKHGSHESDYPVTKTFFECDTIKTLTQVKTVKIDMPGHLLRRFHLPKSWINLHTIHFCNSTGRMFFGLGTATPLSGAKIMEFLLQAAPLNRREQRQSMATTAINHNISGIDDQTSTAKDLDEYTGVKIVVDLDAYDAFSDGMIKAIYDELRVQPLDCLECVEFGNCVVLSPLEAVELFGLIEKVVKFRQKQILKGSPGAKLIIKLKYVVLGFDRVVGPKLFTDVVEFTDFTDALTSLWLTGCFEMRMESIFNGERRDIGNFVHAVANKAGLAVRTVTLSSVRKGCELRVSRKRIVSESASERLSVEQEAN